MVKFIKKFSIAFFFFILASVSISMMRGRLLYLDATTLSSDYIVEGKFFHALYLIILVTYIFFAYKFFKTPESDDNYRKIIMGMAIPAYVLGGFGILFGIGCAVLGCSYEVAYDNEIGALMRLEFLDRFFGNQAKSLYQFVIKLPFL